MITILLSRNKLMGLSLIALAALSACADEIEKGRNDRFVSFSVNTQENNGWIDGKDSRVAYRQAEPRFFEPIEMEGQNGKPLYLIGEVTQSSVADVQYVSRGTQIEPSLDGMQPFGVTAFLEGGKYMDNVEVTREESGSTVTWKPASNYLWPAGKVLDFYARHPLALDGLTMNSDLTSADYTVNADNSKQADLMFAVAKGKTEPTGGGSTSLTFNHALTAIKFVCGANMEAGTLKSISLEDVCSQGTYAVEGMTWSDVKTPATFSLSVDKSTAGSKEGDALTDNTQTFFMIPQTLSADAKVKVVFEDATGTKTLTAKKGKEQKLGNNTYYQWGRKDPMLPIIGTIKEYSEDWEDFIETSILTKKWYDKSTSYTDPLTGKDLGSNENFIKGAILNPNIMHQTQTSSGSANYYYKNLWSANCNDFGNPAKEIAVVKTVYDPSPVGFKIPDGKAFTGFTTTGQYTDDKAEVNGRWDEATLEWKFYTDKSKNKEITFPATGCRQQYFKLIPTKAYYYGIASYCWLAIGPSTPNGYRFNAESEMSIYGLGISFYSTEMRARASSVRCVKE